MYSRKKINKFWIKNYNLPKPSAFGKNNTLCSARDWDRIRITWGNPQSGCSDVCSYSKRAYVGVRATYATR
jgi:hypothetical protein